MKYDDANEINANSKRIINNNTVTSKYFEYKTKLIWCMPNNNNILGAGVLVPLKYLSNIWRFLDFPLINCKIEYDLSWWK